MTTLTGKTLTPQGEAILRAINSGLAAMTPARWEEETEKAAASDDEGEWFAPEFAAARAATEGIVWEFDGWKNALDYIMDGSGRLGGVDLVADDTDARTITVASTDEELMSAYETHRRGGNGEAVGEDGDTPCQAAEREGWSILRSIIQGTNHPGCPALAEDKAGRLWIVNDINGPWAIQVSD